MEAASPGAADPDNLLGLRSPAGENRVQSQLHPRLGSAFPLAFLIPPSDPPLPSQRPPGLLRPRGRVVRYLDGATVAEPRDCAHSEAIDPYPGRAMLDARALAFLGALHPRLGSDSPARCLAPFTPLVRAILWAARGRRRRRASCLAPRGGGCAGARRAGGGCPCAAARRPCFSDCPRGCRESNPFAPQDFDWLPEPQAEELFGVRYAKIEIFLY